MPTRQDDDRRQLNKLIIVCQSLIERYSRLAEEYDSNRLATEEIRELIKELIEEVGQ